MLRKICPIGNSQGVTIPKDALDALHLGVGSKVEVEVDEKNKGIIIGAALGREGAIEKEFASRVDDFIKSYKPALRALAKK
ncbi:MAG: AbrB/MazE/SpoVT family DNA-binding domain-containing protein [Deltaproteobacteria bacterium]|nr:AbrB/MazE/SpoVT family DNA-binding domain-containing protein [Deltaproteobacteria bacterium]